MKFLSREPKHVIRDYLLYTFVLVLAYILTAYVFFDIVVKITGLRELSGLLLILMVVSQPVFLFRFSFMHTYDSLKLKVTKMSFIFFILLVIGCMYTARFAILVPLGFMLPTLTGSHTNLN